MPPASFIRDIIDPIPAVGPQTKNSELYNRFRDQCDLLVVPVVDQENNVLGLIERHNFFLSMAAEFGRALWGKKTVTTLMDKAPLVVDCDILLRDFTENMLLERPSELMQGFIGLKDGQYAGVGTALAILKATSHDLQRLAYFDSLTGLANRSAFQDEMERSLARMIRANMKIALLCLDLDRFKTVNDSFGHAIGDQLLIEVADRLRKTVRKGDLVARLGGDEFAIIQVISDQGECRSLAERLLKSITKPYMLGEQRLEIGLSIGIAVSPEDGLNAKNLLTRADLALYRVKTEGRNAYCFFEKAMDIALQARMELEQDLKRAMADAQFHLEYQPLVNLKTGEVVSFEALIRWEHPIRGLVPPAEFIPIVEEMGMMEVLGDWVLNQACKDCARWPQLWRVAVNVSSLQFKGHLLEKVTSCLLRNGLAPNRLELEITEGVILEQHSRNVKCLGDLRQLGVHIAMDDFGTGYSSLSYLRSFTFDKIKIDRVFIKDLATDQNAQSIVRAMVEMAQAIGVAMTAEGVENEAQLDCLNQLNFTEAQGFLFGRPGRSVAPYAIGANRSTQADGSHDVEPAPPLYRQAG